MAVMVLIVAFSVGGNRGSALTGNCASNPNNYFSSTCYFFGDSQASGVYVEWPSAGLNITQAAANNREWIAEHLIFRNRASDAANTTFLELGDTAGGNAILGHAGEWARMWYWVDASRVGVYSENFIDYSPSDGLNRSYGMQWESTQNAWVMYIAGIPKVSVTTWVASAAVDGKFFTGMEVNNAGAALRANKNSGLFTNTSQQWRDTTNTWRLLDEAGISTQVDAPCGSAPTCLQGYPQRGAPGWWTGTWNNAKP